MKLTVITATYQRPDALALCEKYMARQTKQPDQWLVLDGEKPMSEKVLEAIQGGVIKGEAVAFFEDDDLYRADYLEWGLGLIKKGYEIAGEGNAVYYNVANRWWSECHNKRHAALCQTIIASDMLEALSNVIQSYDSQFFDTKIWNVNCGKMLVLPKSDSERRVIGIKGIRSTDGKLGYSGEHANILPQGTHADPSMLQLWRWAGDDAANYSKFWSLKSHGHN